MVNILIKTDSHYNVNRGRVRKVIGDYLWEKKLRGKTEISIVVVGDRQMKKLNKQYRNIDESTDVLSFPQINTDKSIKYVDPPDDILRLGDIIISYPQVINDARMEEKMVDDKIDELIIHGLEHLLGNNHD